MVMEEGFQLRISKSRKRAKPYLCNRFFFFFFLKMERDHRDVA